MRFLSAMSTMIACGLTLSAQQVSDRAFRPAIENPAYEVGTGPVVCLDEAHANFHTLDDRFWAFGGLLRRDAYVVRASRTAFTTSSLAECGILVIVNPQPSADPWNTYPYPTPPAFSPDEIDATHRWVRGGGRLLLIADHMPLAGAAAGLAAAFDVTFTDGFAVAVRPERHALVVGTVVKPCDHEGDHGDATNATPPPFLAPQVPRHQCRGRCRLGQHVLVLGGPLHP